MLLLLQVGLACGLWCLCHSLLVTHAWDRTLRQWLPRAHVLARLGYVIFSTLTLLALMLWIRTLTERSIWDWPGWWAVLRWSSLLGAFGLFWAGSRAYDGKTFLGLSQLRAYFRGAAAPELPFRQEGILLRIRHPWYAGAILFFLFCLPVTDVNAVWRGIFLIYTLIGTELEERKLRRELGAAYAEYQRQVPRYIPRRR